MWAAPVGPYMGLSMSHMVTNSTPSRALSRPEKSMEAIWPVVPPVGMKLSPLALKNFTPTAAAAPQPPSLVELPPRPTMILLTPRAAAARISWPTP